MRERGTDEGRSDGLCSNTCTADSKGNDALCIVLTPQLFLGGSCVSMSECMYNFKVGATQHRAFKSMGVWTSPFIQASKDLP